MARFFQFQAKTEPVKSPNVPGSSYESPWHQPWSEPVRQKIAPALAIALIASGAVLAPPQPAVTATTSVTTSSQVVFPRSFIYQSKTDPLVVQEVITADKWAYPWSEPTRTRTFGVHNQQYLAWGTYTPSAETITEDKWHKALSEPQRSKPSVPYHQDLFWNPSTPATAVTAVTTSTISDQVSFPRSFIYQSKAFAPLDPETQITQTYESRWHYAWSEPVRVAARVAFNQDFFWNPSTPSAAAAQVTTETVSSEVVFQRSFIYQSLAWAPQEIVAPTFVYFNMVQGDTGLTFEPWIIYQASAESPVEDIFPDKYARPWSEPVRLNNFGVQQQDGFFWSTFTPVVVPPTPEVTTQSISPEVVFPRSFIYQSTAFAPLDPETQITQNYASRWYQALSEPVRVQARVAFNQDLFWNPSTPSAAVTVSVTETVTSQVFFQRSFIYQSTAWTPFVPAVEVITEDKWHYAWSEPVRQKPGLGAYLQQALIAPVLNPETQITQNYESRWHQAWSEPVRIKPRLPEGEQQYLAYVRGLETITEDKWHQAWSEPVRTRQLATAQQQFTAFQLNPETQIIQTYESRWHYPWSEPVRIKIDPKLAIALAASGPFAPVLNPETQIIVTYESRWHYAWSEPVRQKPGLGAWLQQFLTPDEQLPLATQVNLTLSATEINGDVAMFGVSVYNQAHKIIVSIKEIPAEDTGVSSISESNDPGVTSISES